jgi:uracil-DNA glycosylase family 4
MGHVDFSKIKNYDNLPEPSVAPRAGDVDGVRWLGGVESIVPNAPKKVMFIGQNPGKEELATMIPFSGAAGQLLGGEIKRVGMNVYSTHFTYAVKFGTRNNDTPKVAEIRKCQKALYNEINAVAPDVIVTLGASALRAVAGPAYKMTQYRGSAVRLEYLPGIDVVPLWHPAYILRNEDHLPAFRADLANVMTILTGGELKAGRVDDFEVIHTPEHLMDFLARLAQADAGNPVVRVAIDCEWHGTAAMRNDGYLRLMQMCGGGGNLTGVVRFYPEATEQAPVDPMKLYPECINVAEAMAIMRDFSQALGRRLGVVGHNIKADGMWLLHYGYDIRPYVYYDTMLAEHLISNLSSFGLTDLTLKYTSMGKYDLPVVDYIRTHPGCEAHGYGLIPDSVLLPYSAGDVQATYRVMEAQSAAIARYQQPRGLNNEYPSMMDATLRMNSHLYEVEQTGIPIDLERLDRMTKVYNNKLHKLVSQMQSMCAELGWVEFNPASTPQVRNLLFLPPDKGGLGLTPIKSTGKRSKSWEWVMTRHPDEQKHYNPSADKETLEMLEEAHPMIRHLLKIRRIEVICKNFLREDNTGGITGNLYPDGRIHPVFSQLTDTGRLRSQNPNVQNWPKASEGYIAEIFEDEETPDSLRSIVLEQTPGWVVIEADFKQAELFVLAGLADDEVMRSALNTPGKDLHDKTAVDSFGIQVLMPDGQPVVEQELLDLAARDPAAFDQLQKTLIYLDSKGKRMTRGEFKDTIRVSAKAINFGIPYGRGAGAIAMQVNATAALGVTKEEIQVGLDGWKSTYAKAWACMEEYQAQANTQQFVENPWGRRRHFRKANNNAEAAANEREAANFPIQSTVADTMAIAADKLSQLRSERGLSFRLFNQVHDAFLFTLPEAEVEATTQLIEEGMGGIDIPMPSGKPTRLGIDVDVFTRWGEK